MNPRSILSAAICLMLPLFLSPAATHYVDLNSANPAPPYSDWSTAATNIQDAINTSSDGDLILVTNGIYASGGQLVYGSLTNRVAITKPITVQSVNGPAVTVIEGNSASGGGALRCVFMSNGAFLSGFTLTNGTTLSTGDAYLDACGGGVWATNNSTAIVSNCVMIANAANNLGGGAYFGNIINCSIIQNSAYSGGGVAHSSVTNSLILSNSASAYGGGSYSATLTDCKVFSNTADYGGGTGMGSIYGCLVVSNQATEMGGAMFSPQNVVNCTIVFNVSTQGGGGVNGSSASSFYNNIIYYNTVSIGTTPNYSGLSAINNCCTAPMPSVSAVNYNNITNEPLFLASSSGDFHLQSNSPCINSGISPAPVSTDLDGNPRVVDELVDIGAYEYQTPTFILPYYWAQKYALPLDGTIDSDGDGMNNWQEAVAGTNPTNAASVLKMLSVSNSISGSIVKWQSVASKFYYLQRSTNLLVNPAFVSIYTNPPNLFFTTLSFVDTTATNGGPYFYRVQVQP
jgi:hypothetical protein